MSKANISTAKPKVGGAVSRASIGTTAPIDATSDLSTDFTNLGYISEDGLTVGQTIESGVIKAWGGDVVDVYQNGKEVTIKFKLIESLNVDVLKTVYGENNVEGSLETAIKTALKNEEFTSYMWIVDTILKGGILKRQVINDAKIIEVGEVIYKDDELIAFDLTLSAVTNDKGTFIDEFISKKGETTK